MKTQLKCKICGSNSLQTLNTYKHYAYVCNDCHSVFHSKNKKRYFLEYFIPSRFLRNIIPDKAYARLFHVDNNFMSREDFFSIYKYQVFNETPERLSQVQELKDQLSLAKVEYKSADVLDISGGPGVLCRKFKSFVKSIEFTELEHGVVEAISNAANIRGYKFDFFKDNIKDVVKSKKFDIILIRSSIIFCPNLEEFVDSLSLVLNENGHVLIETIIPTMGEILWWQQLEYKFPRIYSQNYIENVFRSKKFHLKLSYRNTGSYLKNKFRGRKKGFGKFLFTWVIEYPMVLAYQIINIFKNIAIDKSMNHKMLTQIWEFNNKKNYSNKLIITKDYLDSNFVNSSHFTKVYNGYLRNKCEK